MKTLYLDAWDSDTDRNNFLEKIKTLNPDRVVFFAHQEFEYNDPNNLKDFFEIVDWHRTNNKIFYITTAGFPNVNDFQHPNVKIYYFTDWFFKKTFAVCYGFCRNLPQDNDLNFYKRGISVNEFNHFLTSLNYNGHRHRKLMIDLLAKNDLISGNAIAWHNVEVAGSFRYNFKYFKPQVLELSNNFSPCWDKPPDQYINSFAQLVSESRDTEICFSEKTAMALICHKPFLIAGAVDTHKKLQDFGFELYTELFDYSFDNEQNEEKRYQMIMDNFVNLKKEFEKDRGKKLQSLILPKLNANFLRLKKVACDYSTVPDIVTEVRECFKKENINHNNAINGIFDMLDHCKLNG